MWLLLIGLVLRAPPTPTPAHLSARIMESADRAEGAASHRSGEVLWSADATVRSGQSRTFTARGLRRGERYVLVATGLCETPRGSGASRSRRARSARPQAHPDSFGTDFKVYVGSLEGMSLDVGLGHPAETTLNFQPLEDDPVVRVEDRTLSTPNVHCSVTGLAVKAP